MIKNKIEYCDGCNSAIYRHSVVKVTESGKIYCSKCKIPEKESVIFEGFSRGIFCSECKKVVSEDQEKTPDINDRVFCCDEHRERFYKRVETCKCCGVEI